MPELPEVETIARELNRALPGAQIKGLEIRLPKMVKHSAVSARRRLRGANILHIYRRAKLVVINLSNDWTVLIHLRMSGQLIFRPGRNNTRTRLVVGGHPIPGGLEDLPNKFSHVIIRTNRGTLFFNDQRQFGFILILRTEKVRHWFMEHGYGPEPLDDNFTLAEFTAILRRFERRRIKPALLDQKLIAGVGNIYADETCWAAKVNPQRKISTLRESEIKALYNSLRRILNFAISKKGTTADKYRTASGQKGEMQSFLKVYGREGEDCPRCGKKSKIIRTVLAARGTRYCPRCQR